MRKFFGDILCDNLTNEEYIRLRKMKRRKELDNYKIVITSDRRSYDDLTELANYPERWKRVGTFYFRNPDELNLIVKAFWRIILYNIRGRFTNENWKWRCWFTDLWRLEYRMLKDLWLMLYERWINKRKLDVQEKSEIAI